MSSNTFLPFLEEIVLKVSLLVETLQPDKNAVAYFVTTVFASSIWARYLLSSGLANLVTDGYVSSSG